LVGGLALGRANAVLIISSRPRLAVHNGTPVLFRSSEMTSKALGILHMLPDSPLKNVGFIVYDARYRKFIYNNSISLYTLNNIQLDPTKIVSFPWRDIIPDGLIIHYGIPHLIKNFHIGIRLSNLNELSPSHWTNIVQTIMNRDPDDRNKIPPKSCFMAVSDYGVNTTETISVIICDNTEIILYKSGQIKLRTCPNHTVEIHPHFYFFDANLFQENQSQDWQVSTIYEIESAIKNYNKIINRLPPDTDFYRLITS